MSKNRYLCHRKVMILFLFYVLPYFIPMCTTVGHVVRLYFCRRKNICVYCYGKIMLLFFLQHCSSYTDMYNSWSSGQTVLKWSNSPTYSRLWSLTHKPAMPCVYIVHCTGYSPTTNTTQTPVQLALQFNTKGCHQVSFNTSSAKKGGAAMCPLLSV